MLCFLGDSTAHLQQQASGDSQERVGGDVTWPAAWPAAWPLLQL